MPDPKTHCHTAQVEMVILVPACSSYGGEWPMDRMFDQIRRETSDKVRNWAVQNREQITVKSAKVIAVIVEDKDS